MTAPSSQRRSVPPASPSTLPETMEPVIARLDPASELGQRYAGNLARLLDVDLEPRLAGFRSHSGTHPWIGEHIGKWLDAASLVVEATGSEELARKLDDAAAALMDTQEADGYLGTYPPDRRFGLYEDADWDVWVHKYCLIGLLSYHRVTGDVRALDVSRRTVDLLIRTFSGSGARDILKAGTHVGMAATSVLGPVAQLYRATGDDRYLAFAREIVGAWDREGGPRVLSTLLETGKVSQVGNGKAYEMLSNILGLVDLARADPDPRYLEAATRAWRDVADHHLYVSGTASFLEHFNEPDELPDTVSVNMGETCVTVTWLTLTRSLLHLTGEAVYADELERTILNHLSAAQSPDGSAWCYYTPLSGQREYGSGISCCISSGPRGMALVPASVFSTSPDRDELVVSLYQAASAELTLGGRQVTVELATGAPYRLGAALTFTLESDSEFGIRLRRPGWADSFRVESGRQEDGWLVVPARRYRSGDRVEIELEFGMRSVAGTGWNAGRTSLAWGPIVLAYDARGDEPALFDVAGDLPTGSVSPDTIMPWSVGNALAPGGRRAAEVMPFARSGIDGRRARVWAATRDPGIELSAFHGATEIRSSGDLARGSIADYDRTSFASSEDDVPREEAWFGFRSATAVGFRRVVFAHGRSMVHGGWFDRARAVPVVEVMTAPEAGWTSIGELAGYPETDAISDAGLRAGALQELMLDEAVTAYGLRVRGYGSYGEYPGPRRIATCATLTAYAD